MKLWMVLLGFLGVLLPAQQPVGLQTERILNNGGEGYMGLSSAAVAADGRLYLLDGKAFRVYVLDAQGRELHRFGRKGEGPGDLGRPYRLALDAQGKVWVTEVMNRASVFGPEGQFLEVMKVGVNKTGFFSMIRYAGPGLFWGLESQGDESRVQKLINHEGRVQELALFTEPPQRVGEGDSVFYYSNSAYSPYHHFDHQKGVSAMALSTGYEIRLVDEQGKPLRTIRRGVEATAFTPQERVYLEAEVEKIKDWPHKILSQFKKQIPEKRCFIESLRLSPGKLWVFRTPSDVTREEDLPVVVDLFRTEDGAFLGTWTLPGIPLLITDTHIYLKDDDEEDVPVLKICRYTLPESGKRG